MASDCSPSFNTHVRFDIYMCALAEDMIRGIYIDLNISST